MEVLLLLVAQLACDEATQTLYSLQLIKANSQHANWRKFSAEQVDQDYKYVILILPVFLILLKELSFLTVTITKFRYQFNYDHQ